MKKTPEKIYVTEYGMGAFERNGCATVFTDPELEGDGHGTYIRKDIVLDMMEQSVVKGFEHAVKGNNLFTKEQVVELMNEFAKACIKILVDTSVQFREGKLTQQEIDVMIDDFTEAWEKRIENL